MLLLVDVTKHSFAVAMSRAHARRSFPSFTWERLLRLAKFYFALPHSPLCPVKIGSGTASTSATWERGNMGRSHHA